MSQLIDPQLSGQFDRLPPHSIDSEMCCIASMILSRQALRECRATLEAEDFYSTDHQIYFEVMCQMDDDGKPIDTTLLREEFIKRQLWSEVGGAEYMGKMLNTVPSGANAKHYAGIVLEKHWLRTLIAASNDVLRDCYSPHDKADSVLLRSFKRFEDIMDQFKETQKPQTLIPPAPRPNGRRLAELCVLGYIAPCHPNNPGGAAAVTELRDVLLITEDHFADVDTKTIWNEIAEGTTGLLEFLPLLLDREECFDARGDDDAVGPMKWNPLSLKKLLVGVGYDNAKMTQWAIELQKSQTIQEGVI